MITARDLCDGFSVEGLSKWCRGKFNEYVESGADVDAGDFAEARRVGYVKALEDEAVARPLLVTAVKVDGELGERSSRRRQFDYARKMLGRAIENPPVKVRGNFAQGLFVFYDDFGNFRMSLVTGRVEGRKLVYNSFKRQTHYVSAERTNRTFRDQLDQPLESFEGLREAFSTEALTKQFYHELFGWYEWAISDEVGVEFPNDIHSHKDNRELNPEHMIRLITRLMFVWFIKHKGLVPDAIFDAGELDGILKDFAPNSLVSGNYYNAILQNLFFATLNNEIGQRRFATAGTTRRENEEHYGVKTLFRNPKGGTWFKVKDEEILELFSTVPFLNGGLFECLDHPRDKKTKKILYFDGFSREERVKGYLRRAFVPNRLFFDENRGILSIFKRYNFTVEENLPNDEEVALDPELLGKVFENLLGAYNPETKETVRKTTGSFYTPREIVNYMVDESLKQHLKTHADVDEGKLTELFEGEPGTSPFSKKKSQKLANILRNVKVLDPACGSGAFPMGVLHRLVDLLSKLEGGADNVHDLKLHLIENCIYGVDIQTIAVQISKLRFFISLVCEQEKTENWKKNFGIKALPNLETKFVAANTLIGIGQKEEKQADFDLEDEEIAHLRKLLAGVRHKYFLSKSSVEKQKLRKMDRDLCKSIQKRIIELASTPNLGKIADLEGQIRKLKAEKAKFAGEKWVKEAQATLGLGEGVDEPEKAVDVNKRRRDQIQRDIDRKTHEIAQEEKKKAPPELIGKAEALASWDPYNQNRSSSFFDTQWMFGIRDGFDVVIGNPPYVRIQELEAKNAELLKRLFTAATGKFDLYVCFIEQGFNLLKSAGSLVYINPNKFLNASYGIGIRSFIRKTNALCRLIDFGDVQNFTSATTYTCILMLHKTKNETFDYLKVSGKCDFSKEVYDKTCWQSNAHPETTDSWIFSDAETGQLDSKLSKYKRLISGCDEIYQGLVSGGDKLFYLELISFGKRVCRGRSQIDGEEYEIETPVCFKLLKGAEIKRYAPLRARYLAVYPYQSGLGGKTRLIDESFLKRKYPKCFKYLSGFRNELEKRGSERMKYKHWYAYWCPRSLTKFQTPKILTQVLSSQANFTLDNTQNTLFVGGGNAGGYGIIPKRDYSLLFMLGLLNSKLLDSTLQRGSSVFRGGFYSYARRFLEVLPLCTPPKGVQQEIEKLVKQALDIKAENVDADIVNLEKEIDSRIYKLYSLTKKEIALIENSMGGDGARRQSEAAEKLAKVKKLPGGGDRGRKSSVMVDDSGLD